jgi:exodeoxyribonuclease V beta subunit
MSMQTLDPLTCPLTGRQLIEASAGTGKTYTIAMLFLRLLIESRLQVDQILVVTFTDAATEELRDRIRSRVHGALEHLRGLAHEGPDPLLKQFLENIQDQDEAGVLLADALVRMDEASVFTIHGFCGRMLRDNAFDSGMPFDMEFITDEESLRHEIMQDFWRIRSAELDLQQTNWLLEFWKTPEALLKSLKAALPHTGLKIIPDIDPAAQYQPLERLESDFQALCRAWELHGNEVEELLRKTPSLNRRSYKSNVIDGAIGEMRALVAMSQCPMSWSKKLERFSTEMLSKQTKPDQDTPRHEVFDLVDQLMSSHENIPKLMRAAWQTEALGYLNAELSERKQRHGQLYFDDLLRGMANGLEGQGGERLAQRVRSCFPVALIDEFQDTDPLQYSIFKGIYTEHENTGLFMIGDPKQAIYSFRGADIFTYMQARRETAESGNQYTLDTNWRSCSDLVECVNALFGRAAVSNPFIYQPDIVFDPVNTSEQADRNRLQIAGEIPKPLRFWLLDGEDAKPLDIGKAKERAAAACAEEIARLLQLADRGQACVGDQPLLAREIAVLVRTHAEASLMQQALRECGVTSVTQDRENVFDSPEAHDLAMLLNAIAEPDLEQQLRTALVSDLLGYSLSDMSRLVHDDVAWDELQQRFKHYRAIWLRQGFMVSFQRLLHDENLPRKLLAHVDGDRRLTNLMHLAELLQLASMERPGIDGVIRWFEQQGQDSAATEASELRLENDEALVQIITIHKSKGLEFPVVFLPFPWVAGGKSDLLMFHDEDTNELTLDLASEQQDEHRLLEKKESLAERLRLFYVAVTRAKHLCVMTWGRIKHAELSAPAWLLHQVASPEPGVSMPAALGQIREQLESLAEDAGGRLEIEDLPEVTGIKFEPAAGQAEKLQAARSGSRLLHDWRQVSYSGLTAGVETDHPDHDAVKDAAKWSLPSPETDDIFRFPRGPQAGTFMHTLLETMDFTTAGDQVLTELVNKLLSRHGFDDAWTQTLLNMLHTVVSTELDEHGLCLAQVTRIQRCDEMAFSYPLENLSPAGLHGVLGSIQLYSSTSNKLQFDPVRGLMRGFIDLVFEHDGRFYLVDYKSNHLGDRPQDYDTDGLRTAMQLHKYDLQYLIYTVALHRYLGQRVPDYDYQQHFGGVYYLFLRGMCQGHRYGIYHDRPEQGLIEALDQLFTGKRQEAA